MPLRLFRSREVTGSNIVMALLVVGLFGLFFLGALYLQRVLGYAPLQVGLAFLPSAVVMGATRCGSPCASRRGRSSPRPLLIAAGLLLFMRAPVDGTYVVDILPATILIGLGAGLSIPALMTLAMSRRAADRRRLASGLVNTTVQVGGAIGLAVLATLAGERTGASQAPRRCCRVPPGVPDRRRDARPRRARRAGPAALHARASGSVVGCGTPRP